eukprot:5716718-Amphidinium_carterae.1
MRVKLSFLISKVSVGTGSIFLDVSTGVLARCCRGVCLDRRRTKSSVDGRAVEVSIPTCPGKDP